jgi:hypothetical protein
VAIEIRDANRFGPLTAERLATLERELKVPLPADYRDFLLKHNGGRPDLQRFTFTPEGDEEQESVVEWFFAVHDQPYEPDEGWEPGEDDDFMPYFAQPLDDVWKDFRSERPGTNTLPIGRDPCANLICLGYTGAEVGRVYFYDHEVGMLYPIAATFTEFLRGLSRADED